uniref:AMADH1 n=1 Tax=Arundo donax TaxID=35708 RepID=A0A0A8XU76_ARUDO
MWASVAGLTTGRRRPSAGARHSPSTKRCRCGIVAGEAIGECARSGWVGSDELGWWDPHAAAAAAQ